MTLAEVRSRYRDQIVAAANRRGAHNIRVFGSVARGDGHLDSDIDFLVDFEPGRSLLDLTGLLLDLETVLECKVDVVSEVRSRYRDQIVAAANRRGAHNIRVFGSVARGDQHLDSDIDFLVDFEPGRSKSTRKSIS